MSDTLLRTSNPTLNQRIFENAQGDNEQIAAAMTIQGAAIKTLILVGIVLVAAAYTWSQVLSQGLAEHGGRLVVANSANLFALVGCLGGFVLAMVTVFKPHWSPWTAPLYAVAQGLAMGAISAIFERVYPGIVIEAVGITIGTLVILLAVYASGLLAVTDRFKAGVVAATGAICLVYFISWILGLFGIPVPFIHESGWIGIGFSVVVVIVAALNLVLDFDVIATQARIGAPKYMEWYCGFSLLVTLVWLYLEILRLLAKLRQRN
jgi:uncharacterized YccA/Bax inhibitor family protein